MELIRQRLGLAVDESLKDIEDVITAVRLLMQRDGGRRLTTQALLGGEIDTEETPADAPPPEQVWNIDGQPSDFDLANIVLNLTQLGDYLRDES
jgi:hypothetical protein